jgi:ADP-heptose:LPS heptosyltransferase
MEKVLIVNLRRLGDVYSTAHLINSIAQDRNCEIEILVYKESEKAAKNLARVSKVHTIDRHELSTIMTNKLFSETYALDNLANSLNEIRNTSWNTIVNFSNDIVGSNICSSLRSTTEKIVGISFNENRNVTTTSTWEIVFNDVLTTVDQSPIHFVDCYHRMMGISNATTGNKIITNSAHDENAIASMTNIRANYAEGKTNAKVIGIQLFTSKQSKNISKGTIVQYIQLLKNSGDFIPLLLIAPNNEERNYANQINEEFNSDLIVVEADLTAVASVLSNIDLLVTPDTVIKHISDLIECPVLEISLGEAPFLKQGSYNEGNLILTDVLNNRAFNRNSESTTTNITANDIYASTVYYFAKTKNIKPKLSSDVTLYKCNRDHIGATYTPVAGTIECYKEFERLMSRQFLISLLDNSISNEIYTDLVGFGIPQATNWCNKEKGIITEVMKDLLGTLRSLLQSLENKRSSRDFIINLSKLMAHCDSSSVTQIAVIIFKTKIEGINARSFEENAKEVELLIYELKSYLQKNLTCIKQLEDTITHHKKDELINRNSQP